MVRAARVQLQREGGGPGRTGSICTPIIRPMSKRNGSRPRPPLPFPPSLGLAWSSEGHEIPHEFRARISTATRYLEGQTDSVCILGPFSLLVTLCPGNCLKALGVAKSQLEATQTTRATSECLFVGKMIRNLGCPAGRGDCPRRKRGRDSISSLPSNRSFRPRNSRLFPFGSSSACAMPASKSTPSFNLRARENFGKLDF